MASRDFVYSAALAAALFAAPSSFGTGAARADEAFLCGPSTVVYVKPEELEFKKKTDACIAGYFGLTVDAAEADKAKLRSLPKSSNTVAPKQPVKSAAAASFKTLDVPEREKRRETESERAAFLAPPEASPGTDFRNVKVINAAGDAQWFRHVR